jgi:hypothetical protein
MRWHAFPVSSSRENPETSGVYTDLSITIESVIFIIEGIKD